MLKHNDINIVGIDHGFGNLKTAVKCKSKCNKQPKKLQ